MNDSQPGEQIREYYDSRNPEEKAIQRMRPPRRFFLLASPSARIAAVVLVLAVVSWGIWPTTEASAVVQAMARVHKRGLEPEYRLTAVPALCSAMDRLGFEFHSAEDEICSRFEVVGSRYCTIADGEPGAQICVREPGQQETSSLFVYQETPALKKISGTTTQFNGVEIEVWSEGKFCFAHARELP